MGRRTLILIKPKESYAPKWNSFCFPGRRRGVEEKMKNDWLLKNISIEKRWMRILVVLLVPFALILPLSFVAEKVSANILDNATPIEPGIEYILPQADYGYSGIWEPYGSDVGAKYDLDNNYAGIYINLMHHQGAEITIGAPPNPPVAAEIGKVITATATGSIKVYFTGLEYSFLWMNQGEGVTTSMTISTCVWEIENGGASWSLIHYFEGYPIGSEYANQFVIKKTSGWTGLIEEFQVLAGTSYIVSVEIKGSTGSHNIGGTSDDRLGSFIDAWWDDNDQYPDGITYDDLRIWYTDETIAYQQDFQVGQPGMQFTWGSDDYIGVVYEPGSSTERCLYGVYDRNGPALASDYVPCDFSKSYSITLRFKPVSSYTNYQGIAVIDVGGVGIYFADDSKNEAYLLTETLALIGTISLNEWHTFSIIADPASLTYTVSVDGVQLGDTYPLQTQNLYNTLYFGHDTNMGGRRDYGEAYWDDLVIYGTPIIP